MEAIAGFEEEEGVVNYSQAYDDDSFSCWGGSMS